MVLGASEMIDAFRNSDFSKAFNKFEFLLTSIVKQFDDSSLLNYLHTFLDGVKCILGSFSGKLDMPFGNKLLNNGTT